MVYVQRMLSWCVFYRPSHFLDHRFFFPFLVFFLLFPGNFFALATLPCAPVLRALLRPSCHTRCSASRRASERTMDFQRWGSGRWDFFFSWSVCCLAYVFPFFPLKSADQVSLRRSRLGLRGGGARVTSGWDYNNALLRCDVDVLVYLRNLFDTATCGVRF